MIHELRDYEFMPEAWVAYEPLFRTLGLPARGDAHGRLVGAWVARESGRIRFVHLWAYDSLDARAALRARLAGVPAWANGFIPRAKHLARSQRLSVLNPVAPTPQRPLDDISSVYLHRYRCAVGHAATPLAQLSAASLPEAASLGLWSTEFPDPNQLVQLSTRAEPAVLQHVQEVETLHLSRFERASHGTPGELSSSKE